jgi:hypothetical protein
MRGERSHLSRSVARKVPSSSQLPTETLRHHRPYWCGQAAQGWIASEVTRQDTLSANLAEDLDRFLIDGAGLRPD